MSMQMQKSDTGEKITENTLDTQSEQDAGVPSENTTEIV